jgi:hypothetical protein
MINWRKSSYSGGGDEGGQDCVEVAAMHGLVGLRDSKAPGAGHLTLSPAGFGDLLTRLKQERAGR